MSEERQGQAGTEPGQASGPGRDLGRLLSKVAELDLHLNLPAAGPKGTLPARARRAAAGRAGARGRRRPGVFGLWLLSAPLLCSAVIALAVGRLGGFAGDALAWGLIALGALLTRRSADDTAAPQQRFSRRLRLPRKHLGGLAVAAGVTVAAVLRAGHTWPVGIAFGALAALAFHLIYRFEPPPGRAQLSAGDRESRQVAAALAEAEQRLITIERAAGAVGNAELEARLGRIAAEGRGILAQIAERPSDLRRARRFLTVFLEGAEQVSDGYVRTHRHSDTPELTQNFRSVLETIEAQFRHQRRRLQQADVMDLDVQIEVLKKQLEQEGIR
ncbi:5-bromo-4-chloroindolyl phosphate hydrolysis family protein [uncultured Thiohalocapsa sp.]|uniref:5-bromo-4-chloroindolyl phosphate hydrolysis family protein n=1 Tax=uncultured Thiohalocapsa sp. TaxID=768990 RepID=UPI0025CDA221|nr:5-bromo-4-chloroindolyl phosphate hydrolysis family protein [uncultured Thiohalocapsa sp.]